MLIDIVSKNGQLMLSVPLKGNGTHDTDELKILDDLGIWMSKNGEGIYATRPWKVYGEGPSTVANNQARGQFGGARDVRAYTAEDFRFTSKGDTLYAFMMAWPENGKATIKSLAQGSENLPRQIAKVELLGRGEVKFVRNADGLVIDLPAGTDNKFPNTLKITPA